MRVVFTRLTASLGLTLLSLSALAACDLLLGPAPIVDDDGARTGRDRDDCDDDSDCDGGEFCDDGTCEAIANEGEGDGTEGEGEGDPPPPPPPSCDTAGCPEIVSLSINAAVLGPFDVGSVSAIVTDPDGVTDVIGGTLLDPVTDVVYGTFTSQGGGAYVIDVDWDLINRARAIDLSAQTTRVLRARFFDQAGHDVFGDVDVDLACDDGGTACDGVCGPARCDGACVDVFDSDDNCGRCGNVCRNGAVCERNGSGFSCVGGVGEGEGEPLSTEYSGTREAGVRCGDQTCAACCVDPFTNTATCSDSACTFGGGTCDGPEDCAGNEECCLSTFTASCTPTGECRAASNREICVTSADCQATELCCTDTFLVAFGVDAGACTAASATGTCP